MVSDKIILKRSLDVEFFECLATIRRKEKVPYITSVLKLAVQSEQITPELLRDELLPGESLALSTNIIKRHTQLGFIDENGVPKYLGIMAAKGNVLMPERGKYIIGVTKDPLVNNRIIYIKVAPDITRNTYSSTNSNKDKSQERKMAKIPQGIIGKHSLVWLENTDNKDNKDNTENTNKEPIEILVESIADIVYSAEVKIHFQLEVVISNNSKVISINNEKNGSIKITENLELDLDEIWKLEVKDTGLKWIGNPMEMGRGLIKYKETNASERKSFSKNIPQKEIDTISAGKFTAGPIVVNIQPDNDRDATLWANELIKSEITEYCTEKDYMEICEKVSKKFTDSSPNISNIEEFLKYLRDKDDGTDENSTQSLPMEYWYLQAPRDLKPEVI